MSPAAIARPPKAVLSPGDVLSYSAGSSRTDPLGFRVVRPRGMLLAPLAALWPDLVRRLGNGPRMLVNAYPATLGAFPDVVTVDTFLSPRVFSRALELARHADHAVIVAGPPLVVADGLLRHLGRGLDLPRILMISTGGYAMPRSLEAMLRARLRTRVRVLVFVQCFGVSEVDECCLVARDRDGDSGRALFHPRPDVTVEPDGHALRLTLRGPDRTVLVDRFVTGDYTRRSGDGWIIWNPQRLHPRAEEALESWHHAQWARRTGYLRLEAKALWIQLREGETVEEEGEVEHFEFARRFGSSWLERPAWS